MDSRGTYDIFLSGPAYNSIMNASNTSMPIKSAASASTKKMITRTLEAMWNSRFHHGNPGM